MSVQKNRRPPVLVVIQGEEVKRVDSKKYLGKAKCKEAPNSKMWMLHTHIQKIYSITTVSRWAPTISVTDSVLEQM